MTFQRTQAFRPSQGVHACVYICVCKHLCTTVCARVCVCLCVSVCVCAHSSLGAGRGSGQAGAPQRAVEARPSLCRAALPGKGTGLAGPPPAFHGVCCHLVGGRPRAVLEKAGGLRPGRGRPMQPLAWGREGRMGRWWWWTGARSLRPHSEAPLACCPRVQRAG